MSTTSATHVTRAWSCTVRLVVDDPRVLRDAAADLHAILDRVDRAASRFRSDSALSMANAVAGVPTPVPPLLVELVRAALTGARDSDGLVDPTVGGALVANGYDVDIAELSPDGPDAPARPGGAWQRVRLDAATGLLTVPRGYALDLGATAKAWTADHAAATLSRRYGTAVMVELGGDIAVAGRRPAERETAGSRPDGWCLHVAEHAGGDGQLVLLRSGGLTTSTTTVRRWRRGGRPMHHIVDPRTGRPADGPWRTVTVNAASAFDANVASTAAIVRGHDAVRWLTERGLAARLVRDDGAVAVTPGWPAPAAELTASRLEIAS